MWTTCRHSQQLRKRINDYADIKHWRRFTGFKGTINQNEELGCVSIPNTLFLKYENENKIQCPGGHTNFKLCDRISSRKQKKCSKPFFACSYGTQVECFKKKKVCRKSRDTGTVRSYRVLRLLLVFNKKASKRSLFWGVRMKQKIIHFWRLKYLKIFFTWGISI